MRKLKVNKLSIMTVDLETDLGADLDLVFNDILPRLLDEFDLRGIKATFFVVSSLLDKYSSEIKQIALRGHEIASHSRSHSFLDSSNSWEEIYGSKLDFLNAGINVSGFRAPGYVTVSGKDHLKIVAEAGYNYDASFAKFLPFRYWRFGLSKKAYVARCTKSKLIELPMPTMIWPSGLNGLSYLKLFYPLSLLFVRMFGMRYMFYLHPWEFIDSSRLRPLGIFERLIAYNCGTWAWKIFMFYLDLADRRGIKWVSCKEYLVEKGMLD